MSKKLETELQRNRNQLSCCSPYSLLGFIKHHVINLLSDERVKNERAFIAKTIKRIIGESIATLTLEHPAATKSVKATKFRKTRQY